MPIIFFLVSLFFSNESALNLNNKAVEGSTKETTKPTNPPSNGEDFIITAETMP